MQSLPTELDIIIRRTYIAHLMDIPFIGRIQCRTDTALFTIRRTVRTVVIRLFTVPMARQPGRLPTTHILARTNRALPSQPLTAGKALGRPTTLIPEPTRQRVRDPARPRSGVNPTFRTEINPRTLNTTPLHKEPWAPCRVHRAERQSALPLPTAMQRSERLRAVTCTLERTGTSTRTPARAGRNMTTVPAPGTP